MFHPTGLHYLVNCITAADFNIKSIFSTIKNIVTKSFASMNTINNNMLLALPVITAHNKNTLILPYHTRIDYPPGLPHCVSFLISMIKKYLKIPPKICKMGNIKRYDRTLSSIYLPLLYFFAFSFENHAFIYMTAASPYVILNS